mmetsp:Transcript_2064/g.4215  ORF Transcript_2064/g.4215 Transcript_2064/m.4215 type:complete len:226 (-) Transcript_2064:71-748(-)
MRRGCRIVTNTHHGHLAVDCFHDHLLLLIILFISLGPIAVAVAVLVHCHDNLEVSRGRVVEAGVLREEERTGELGHAILNGLGERVERVHHAAHVQLVVQVERLEAVAVVDAELDACFDKVRDVLHLLELDRCVAHLFDDPRLDRVRQLAQHLPILDHHCERITEVDTSDALNPLLREGLGHGVIFGDLLRHELLVQQVIHLLASLAKVGVLGDARFKDMLRNHA